MCKIHILYHQNKNKKAPRFVLGQSRNIKVCFIFYKILKIDICWKLQRPLLQPVRSLVELNCKGYKDSVARLNTDSGTVTEGRGHLQWENCLRSDGFLLMCLKMMDFSTFLVFW